jgi:small neutral amino acid transporter SnatA (MarC family)
MPTAGLSTGSRAVLAFFGISVPVVEVGGGLVVIAVGWKLLNWPDTDDKAADSP